MKKLFIIIIIFISFQSWTKADDVRDLEIEGMSLGDSLLEFLEHDIENNVLINSNFNCGFYIDRDKLHNILRSSKYNIETAYDPCSYPGVKSKFYFNHEIGFDITQQRGKLIHADRTMKMSELDNAIKYSEISFMMFRTGSCLIVGNCTERILRFVYNYIKQILNGIK